MLHISLYNIYIQVLVLESVSSDFTSAVLSSFGYSQIQSLVLWLLSEILDPQGIKYELGITTLEEAQLYKGIKLTSLTLRYTFTHVIFHLWTIYYNVCVVTLNIIFFSFETL